MKNIFWTGYSNGERHAALALVTGIIGQYGAVVDFKPFSDLSITLVIEAEGLQIDNMYRALAENLTMDPCEPLNTSSKVERTVYLNLTFTKGTGDVRIEVPAVPG